MVQHISIFTNRDFCKRRSSRSRKPVKPVARQAREHTFAWPVMEINQLLNPQCPLCPAKENRSASGGPRTTTRTSTCAPMTAKVGCDPMVERANDPAAVVPAPQGRCTDARPRKSCKWTPDEDRLVIELRGQGMKWDRIAEHLPGRTPLSCRLRYQNFLEKLEWSEEKKRKLAHIYARCVLHFHARFFPLSCRHSCPTVAYGRSICAR